MYNEESRQSVRPTDDGQDFIVAVEDESDRVAAELARVQAQLEPLIKRRRDLVERARTLETVKSVYDPTSRQDGGVPATETRRFLDVAHDLLRNEGPLYYETIVSKLSDLGVTIPGRQPGANLIAQMSRSPRFKRVGRGTYAANT